jgi:hypothetical protein
MENDIVIIENPNLNLNEVDKDDMICNKKLSNFLIKLTHTASNIVEIIDKEVTLENYEEIFNKLFYSIVNDKDDTNKQQEITWKKVFSTSGKLPSLSIIQVNKSIQKGWVYNSASLIEHKLYELSLIQLNNYILTENIDVETQISVENGVSTNINKETQISKENIDKETQTSFNTNAHVTTQSKSKSNSSNNNSNWDWNYKLQEPIFAKTTPNRKNACKYPELYDDPFPGIPYIPLYNRGYKVKSTSGYGDNPFDLSGQKVDKQKKQLNHRQKSVYHDINTNNQVTLKSNNLPNLVTCTINFDNTSSGYLL